MSQYNIISFQKTESEIINNYKELVKGKSVPQFYKNLINETMEKIYVPVYLFKGSIDGKEERVYKNVSHSMMITPVVSTVSRKVSYDGNNKSGSAKFIDYPLVANSEFNKILQDTFGCESTLEPFQYEEAVPIDDVSNYQFDENVASLDIKEERLIEIAKEKMEHVLSVRMYEGTSGSFVGGLDKYHKLVEGQIVYVPIYYKKIVVEGAGAVYVVGNGQSGDVYISILDRINGYLPISNIAKYAVTTIAAGIALALGALVHSVVSFIPLAVALIIFGLIGAFIGYRLGDKIADKIFTKQVNDLRAHCMHGKDVSYYNSGLCYVEPGTLWVR